MLNSMTKGTLDDGTVYFIDNYKHLIINGRVWFTGNEKEIEDYIERLNNENS